MTPIVPIIYLSRILDSATSLIDVRHCVQLFLRFYRIERFFFSGRTHLISLFFVLSLSVVSNFTYAADYFWIGGSGNWSDISHWATTSGGGVTHNQAPTADDNVIFDANSFTAADQTITLNSDIIFCRNMTWQGVSNNPSLLGSEMVTLNIYGGIQLIPAMNFDFQGTMVFAGNEPGNAIDLGPHRAGKDVTFSGAGGWILNSPLLLDGFLTFNEGNLNTSGRPVECQYFSSQLTGVRTLNLGASVITISGETLERGADGQPVQALHLNATNLTMRPGNSTFVFTASIVDLWMQGPGNINFNRVVLNNPMGNSRIIPWLPFGNSEFPVMNYNELELFHNTLLNGSPNIGQLTLFENQRYLFEAGQTFTLGTLNAVGSCRAGISIESTDLNNPAIFQSDNTIAINFVALKGIHTQGGANFRANNTIDLGGNDGWRITLRTPAAYFWVGGTGNWDDPTNWSLSSGGPSSGCIPTALDDVFFDANSFNAPGQAVLINVENAYCKNMSWEGARNNPSLIGPIENAIRVNGSLTFIPNMNHGFEGNYFFESSEKGNRIRSAGQPFNFDLFFTNPLGEWILRDDLFVFHKIDLLAGTFRTNDNPINCNAFISTITNARQLYLGDSYILVADRGSAVDWRLNTDSLLFDAGGSTIEISGGPNNVLLTNGSQAVTYNNVLFSAQQARLNTQVSLLDAPITIDSLIFINDGFLSGDASVNYWKMSPGRRYHLSTNKYTITELEANGNCNEGVTSIRNISPNYTTEFQIGNDHSFEYLHLQGIHQIGSGRLNANNSIDGGDNQNWRITNLSPRTLFWVGDAGDWHEEANWSLSSGGPGGECLPTSIDEVVFDRNSFTTNSALITSDDSKESYCHNMRWEAGVNGSPQLSIIHLNIHGSLSINSQVEWLVGSTFFKGEETHQILSEGTNLGSVYFECNGSYELEDDLNCRFIRHTAGTFNTNNQNLFSDDYVATGPENPKRLILGDSYVQLSGNNLNRAIYTFSVVSDGLVVEPGTSRIEITNENVGIRMDYPIELTNIQFSNPAGTAQVLTQDGLFNTLSFFGNGEFMGNSTIDTLLFAAGKSYILEAGQTQTVTEYWQIIGNNCTPIELSSSLLGSLAIANMPAAGRILADFIQMRDIQADGGADFLAGIHSTDIANSNTGWTFESAPEFIEIGFLGTDRVICFGEPVTLNAYSFSFGESYLWQDGSTDSIFVANQPGQYSVEVTFSNNCVIQDEIAVLSGQEFAVDLEDGLSFCSGDSLVLNANPGVIGAFYSWQDDSTADSLIVTTPGLYSVAVELDGCVVSDSTQIAEVEFPDLDLGTDVNACVGEDFTLSANVQAETFLWQDNSTSSNFTGSTPGVYWLEAANGLCATRDSLEVFYIDPNIVNLGNDTTLCDQTSFRLDPSLTGVSYSWQDGSTDSFFEATESGAYSLEINLQGCTASDTINLNFQDNPELTIAGDYEACIGESITLSTSVIADAYEWSDGSSGSNFTNSVAGDYSVEARFGECLVSENFNLSFLPPPSIDLGSDTTLCTGTPLLLNAQEEGLWQDGSISSSFNVY